MIGWMGGWLCECFLGPEVPGDAIFNSLFSTITVFFFLVTFSPLFLVSVVFVFALVSSGDLLLIPYPEIPYG